LGLRLCRLLLRRGFLGRCSLDRGYLRLLARVYLRLLARVYLHLLARVSLRLRLLARVCLGRLRSLACRCHPCNLSLHHRSIVSLQYHPCLCLRWRMTTKWTSSLHCRHKRCHLTQKRYLKQHNLRHYHHKTSSWPRPLDLQSSSCSQTTLPISYR
jgi:hypothetical protein